MMDGTSSRKILFKRKNERRSQANYQGKNRRRENRRNPDFNWIPLFRKIDQGLIRDALDQCRVLLLPAGAPLLKPGEVNNNVYILLSGALVAHLDSNLTSDNAIPIAVGECIGELSAIDGKSVSAWVTVHAEARVLEVPGDVFWQELMTVPGVVVNLMVSLTERMRRANEQSLKSQRKQLELLHIRKELAVARQLQISMLPLQRPLFPERQDIEVSGFMEPASGVAGDLFDVFFVDDVHLFFCIGDVSGHGIASALFMARIIGLLRIMAMDTLSPDKLLESVNNRLCIGNDANIFVTLFCGYLNVQSGKLIYANGGHCAPILFTAGQHRFIDMPKGALVGAFPEISYSTLEDELGEGDLLFCYTDGVTEAQNQLGEEFSESRCLNIIAKSDATSVPALLDGIRTEVAGFTGSNQLDDDCTMLALRRKQMPK